MTTAADRDLMLTNLKRLKAEPALRLPESGICDCIRKLWPKVEDVLDPGFSDAQATRVAQARYLEAIRTNLASDDGQPSCWVYPVQPGGTAEKFYDSDRQAAYWEAVDKGTMWTPATANTYGKNRLDYLDRMIGWVEKDIAANPAA